MVRYSNGRSETISNYVRPDGYHDNGICLLMSVSCIIFLLLTGPYYEALEPHRLWLCCTLRSLTVCSDIRHAHTRLRGMLKAEVVGNYLWCDHFHVYIVWFVTAAKMKQIKGPLGGDIIKVFDEYVPWLQNTFASKHNLTQTPKDTGQ